MAEREDHPAVRTASWLIAPLFGACVLLAACPPATTAPEDGGEPVVQCEVREDCDIEGQVCLEGNFCADCVSSGQCRLKEECAIDADGGIQRCSLRSGWGTECETNAQCSAGRWCMQGLCKPEDQVRLCPNGTREECAQGERCNTLNLVCEEDLGCSENVDCSAAEVCNTGSHACVPRCTVETQAEICVGGERCVDEKCVQCIAHEECGVGLLCDPAGKCVVQERCYQDRDCKVPLICYAQTGQCVSRPPPCVSDETCAPDERCNVGTGKCIARDCQPDRFEANNDAMSAKALAPALYTDLTLCQNDVDYFVFNLSRGDRLGVDVQADPFAENTFSTVIQDASGRTLSAGKLLTDYVAPTPDVYYVSVSTTDPFQPYDIRFLLAQGTPCDDDGWEPNDLATQPTPLNSSGLIDGIICPQDRDHFSLAVPAGNGVSAKLTGYSSAAGLLRLCLVHGGTEVCSEDPTLPMVKGDAAVVGGQTVLLRVDSTDERTTNSYTIEVAVQ